MNKTRLWASGSPDWGHDCRKRPADVDPVFPGALARCALSTPSLPLHRKSPRGFAARISGASAKLQPRWSLALLQAGLPVPAALPFAARTGQ